MSYQPKVYKDQGSAGGDKLIVASGGEIEIKSGGKISAAGTQASAIADFTGGTNITAATGNSALEDSAATNPSETNFNNNMKDILTKVNLILAALRGAGIIAS